MLRIIYMGTPQFAVPALEALVWGSVPGTVLSEGYEIATVITRPDKPVGRKQEIVYSPIKQVALAHGLSVWQPGSLKKIENQTALAAYQADLFIVAAFGQILPQPVLDLSRYGTLNIHASLLPKYRGSSPISETILQGEHETGVTIMLIDAGVDTGPMLLQRSLPIDAADTTASLSAKLAKLGASALLEILPAWIGGQISPQPQDQAQATHTHMLKKEDGRIDWSQSAETLARQVRAYIPWPNAYTTWNGKQLKLLAAYAQLSQSADEHSPGQVFLENSSLPYSPRKILRVVCSQGDLCVVQVQLEGKKAMSVDEFARGNSQIHAAILV